MKLAEEYLCVGVAKEPDTHPCVVIAFPSLLVKLPEVQARKLADDILRNANYLWPVDEEKTL